MKEAIYRERASEDVKTRYSQAVDLLDHDRFNEAEPIFRQITRDEPGFAPAYNKLGVLHIKRRQPDEARRCFEQALAADREFAPALANLGNLAQQDNRRDEARRYYERALESDSDYGPAHNNLGVLLRREGRYAEAIGHLKRARRRKSYHVSPDGLSSPSGRRGCVFLAVLVVTILAGLLYMFLR
jgi:tetratricopeptide (TPR) repeat protein